MSYNVWNFYNEKDNIHKYIYNGTWINFFDYLQSDGSSFINILKSQTQPFYLELPDITINTLYSKKIRNDYSTY